MKSKLTNNQILLNEIIKQDFIENGKYSTEDLFFEFFSAEHTLKKYDLSYEEIERGIKGAGLDGGCDSIFLFLNGTLITDDDFDISTFPKDKRLELFILQSKNTTTFKEDSIMKWKTISNNLLKFSNQRNDYKNRYNEDVLNSFDLFKSTYIDLMRSKSKVQLSINFIYITKGIEIHPNVNAQANELKKQIKELYPNSNVTTTVEFVGADKIMSLLSVPKTEEFSLKLAEPPIAIDSKKDYIGLVNLFDYYKFITDKDGELIKHIFESNVRDYQGSVTVNYKIQETLKERNGEDFWWFNNGVTIIASEAIQATGKELIITDPEIVNGLQTSTEIFNYFKNIKDEFHDDKRRVLVRLIVPENDVSRDKIILATNSQTNIPNASLRTTDSIHRQIELYLKTKGLYYDRRKNYYKNMGKKPNDIISVSFLAQCLMSILIQKPDVARARPSSLLSDDVSYKALYLQNHNLSTYYNAAYIGKKVEDFIKKNKDYSPSERGDISFYVLFVVCATLVGKIKINSEDLIKININNIDDTVLNIHTDMVYKYYKELGGNNKIAKGTMLIEKLKTSFQFINPLV